MMLYEEGAFELKDPVSHGSSRRSPTPGLSRGIGLQTDHRAGDRTDAHLAPAHPHLRPHLRVPPPTRHRCAVPVGRIRMGHAAGAPISPSAATGGRRSRSRSSPAASGTTGSRPTCSVESSRSCPGMSLDDFLRQRIFEPLGCRTPGSSSETTSSTVSQGSTARIPPTAKPSPARSRSSSRNHPPACRAVVDCGAPRATTCGSATSCSTVANSTVSVCSGSRTLDYMVQNHLPGGADLEEFGRPLFAETSFDGVGFGLGFSVQLDP